MDLIIERSEKIIKIIDERINKYYNYNEPNLSKVAIAYIKRYINLTNDPPRNLKILCTTSYLIAMKYLLDSSPILDDYSNIVNEESKILSKKELEICNKFSFNFTPELE